MGSIVNYCRGEESERKAGFSREQVQAALAHNGKLSMTDALHCRVRYFSDGVALRVGSAIRSHFMASWEKY
jgi:hypothetical protein